MNPRIGWIAMAVAVLATPALAGALDDLRRTPASGGPLSVELATRYEKLASFQQRSYDWGAARRFANKGLAAARGERVLPEDVWDYDVTGRERADLQDARARLVAALDRGEGQRFPALAAHAQVNFDCWVELQSEGWRTANILNCRNAYQTAMSEILDRSQTIAQMDALAEVPRPPDR